MALLTDVFVASPSGPRQSVEPRATLRIDHVGRPRLIVLSDLVRALGAEAGAERLAGDDNRLVYGEKGGPWVFHPPDVIQETLTKSPTWPIAGFRGRMQATTCSSVLVKHLA
jgi:hypothetical protein